MSFYDALECYDTAVATFKPENEFSVSVSTSGLFLRTVKMPIITEMVDEM